MPIATGLAIGLGALAAGGSVAGGALAANGAGAQADAASQAAQLQHQDAQAALAFQKQQYSDQQKNVAPWLQAGQGAIGTLSGLLQNGGFPAWDQKFQAPTGLTEQNDPGYQARLDLGTKAIERSAAAKGGLLSGGTAKSLNQFGQDYASNEYNNVYGRAQAEYQQQYNQFQQNQANQFNRLASISGLGQTAAGQLGQSGQAASTNIANILGTEGQQVGSSLAYGGNARQSGYAGIGSAINGGMSNLSSLLMLGGGNSALPYLVNPGLASSLTIPGMPPMGPSGVLGTIPGY